MEIGRKELRFLDLNIKLIEQAKILRPQFNKYHKPTFTGISIPNNSSQYHKLAAIISAIHRLHSLPWTKNDYTMQEKKKVLFEWIFFGKKFCCGPKKNSHLVGRAEKMAFPPLNYDQKVEFWLFLAFLTFCVQHCSHSRASVLVQLDSLESSDLFYAGGSTRKSLWGPGGIIQEHLL